MIGLSKNTLRAIPTSNSLALTEESLLSVVSEKRLDTLSNFYEINPANDEYVETKYNAVIAIKKIGINLSLNDALF